MNIQNPKQDKSTFSNFFAHDVDFDWLQASVEQKEFQLHQYLNIECGAGVFTNQVDSSCIKIHYDDTHEIIIKTTNDLASIDVQLERFLSSL
jgi:hypothetical protein